MDGSPWGRIALAVLSATVMCAGVYCYRRYTQLTGADRVDAGHRLLRINTAPQGAWVTTISLVALQMAAVLAVELAPEGWWLRAVTAPQVEQAWLALLFISFAGWVDTTFEDRIAVRDVVQSATWDAMLASGPSVYAPQLVVAAVFPDGSLEYHTEAADIVLMHGLDEDDGEEVIGVPDVVSLRDGLVAAVSDVSLLSPEEFAPNPVAGRLLAALGAADRPCAGMVVLVNEAAEDSPNLIGSLTDDQRNLIDRVHAGLVSH